MPLTTFGLAPSLDHALHSAVEPSLGSLELCVIGVGPLVRKKLWETTSNDWKSHFDRLEQSVSIAQSVALAADALGRPARVIFMTHPPELFRESGFMLNAVHEGTLAGLVEFGGIGRPRKSLLSNVIATQYAGSNSDSSDFNSVDADQIIALIKYLTSPASRHIDKSVLSLDQRGLVVTKIGGASPIIGESDL